MYLICNEFSHFSFIKILCFNIMYFTEVLSESDCKITKHPGPGRILVEEHNRIRQLYTGLPDLCLTKDGPKYDFDADSLVKSCAKAMQLYHSPHVLVGENLGVGPSGGIAEASLGVIRGWFRHCEMVALEGIDILDLEVDENLRACVQMLWKKTRTINCASAQGADSKVYVVCQYYPPLTISEEQIKDNIMPSSDWVDLRGSQSVAFDFNSSTLQIKTAFQSASESVIYLHASKHEQNTVEIDIFILPPNENVTGMRIVSMFCGNSQFMISSNFNLRHTKHLILYTIFLSPKEFKFLVNGKQAVSFQISELVTEASCIEKVRRLTSTETGEIGVIDNERGLVQYRGLPSLRIPVAQKSELEFDTTPELSTFVYGDTITELYTEIITETVAYTTINKRSDDDIESDTYTNRHFIIEDKSGKKIKVIFPAIKATFVDRRDGSVMVYIDRDEPFEGIKSFQLIVQHFDILDKSDKGVLAFKDTLYDWNDANKLYREKGKSVPYIAAQTKTLGDRFVLGDGKTYGGYYNGKVENNRKYSLRVRGIVNMSDKEHAIIDTDVVGTFASSWVTFLSLGGAACCLIFIIGYVNFHLVRKRRKRRRVQETIAKFNTLLEDKGACRFFKDDEVTTSSSDVVDRVVSPSLAVSDGSEWWSSSGSDNGGAPGKWNRMRSATSFDASYSAVEAATKLLSETDKNINRRKSAFTPHDMTISRSHPELDVPGSDMREDEIYNF